MCAEEAGCSRLASGGRDAIPVQRRMCVAIRENCCLRKDTLVCVMSTPSRTVTADCKRTGLNAPFTHTHAKMKRPAIPAYKHVN